MLLYAIYKNCSKVVVDIEDQELKKLPYHDHEHEKNNNIHVVLTTLANSDQVHPVEVKTDG